MAKTLCYISVYIYKHLKKDLRIAAQHALAQGLLGHGQLNEAGGIEGPSPSSNRESLIRPFAS